MKTSSGRGRSTCGGQQAQIAITSRWKCMVALGTPVVPEVKASRQVSSAAVSTLTKAADWRAIAASRPSGEVSLKQRMRTGMSACPTASRSASASRASHRAKPISPLARICPSSLARSSGMVVTAIAPTFITANQQAASIGLLGARSSTRLPGTTPISCTSTLAMRLACSCRSA